ncbi:hypothetical protein GCM10023149_53960 [Mucilaginibacter gynuensis]|uniref:Cell division protein FtsL n=1 Tax=Mucilaginibacter gynuensis TaxID=1302236 RepID=A0ABP8HN17_9SPHI
MATPNKEELDNLKKRPVQWIILTLCSVAAFLFGVYQLRVNKSDENCDQRILTLQRVASKKDSIIYDWQSKYISLSTELLYKNNIIDRQKQVIDKTDSTARTRLEKPAKQIVKSNDK